MNYGGKQGAGSRKFGADPNRPVAKPLNKYLSIPPVARQGTEVFHCPNDDGTPTVRPTTYDFYGTSYITNPMLIGQDRLLVGSSNPCKEMLEAVSNRLPRQNRSRRYDESKLILIGDHGWYYAWEYFEDKRIEWHLQACTHIIAFMDGHVDFVRIRKGLHCASDYTVIPFRDFIGDACDCQEERPCE